MAISRLDMERQLRKDGGVLTLEDAKRMAPPGESLAYINPEEAALLKSLGGAGEDINGTGIKSYFFKKVFKKAKRAVKKIVKSPVGRLGLLAAATIPFGGPMAAASGLFGKAKGLGSLLSGLGSKVSGMSTLGKLGLIGGASGLAGLMAARGQEEEDDDQSIFDRGEGLDIDRIVRLARQNDPQFRFLPGAEFTGAYAKGGKVKLTRKRLVEIFNDSEIERELGPAKDFTTDELENILFKMHGDEIYTPYAEGGEVDKTTAMIMDLLKRGMDDDSISTITGASQEQIDSIKKNKREEKAEGGIMNLGGMEMDLRGGGFVPLGAKEKADDVPARLSKNEFVMTADAVRAAGGGSVDKGADKMYKLMKGLEAQV